MGSLRACFDVYILLFWLLEAACISVSVVAKAAPGLVVVGPAQGKLQQAQKTNPQGVTHGVKVLVLSHDQLNHSLTPLAGSVCF